MTSLLRPTESPIVRLNRAVMISHQDDLGGLAAQRRSIPTQEPDRWLRFDRTGSRDGWRDMAAFAERQRDVALRERLERAIQGKGAFGRFRDLVRQESLAQQWYSFSTDSQLGRAREFLADEDIRVG